MEQERQQTGASDSIPPLLPSRTRAFPSETAGPSPIRLAPAPQWEPEGAGPAYGPGRRSGHYGVGDE